MIKLIDTHCHVHFAAYREDENEVIERALQSHIGIITIGTQSTTSAGAVECAQKHNGVWAAVGLHPNHLHRMPIDEDELPGFMSREENFDADYYRELACDEKVVGIGETGFDAYRVPDGFTKTEVLQKQEGVFRAHLLLADELSKPIIIHCRDAYKETVQILEEFVSAGSLEKRGVMHCFTGTAGEAALFLKLGFYISFSGIVTFPPRKNETENKTLTTARSVPINRMLIETDAPYLAPSSHRGSRNEPAYVVETAKFLSEQLFISPEIFAETTRENSKNLFGLQL